MSANKPSTGTDWVDPDDAPELSDAFFEHADEYVGEKLIKRGRPKSVVVRERITIRLEPDVVQQFKASGPGWQTRMNAALVDWLKTHEPSEISI
ncbi:BrnA antitoxin family protein [Pseudomonas sp. UBA1879]|uniref:BrnA antitoxin family protein n=1 Tax=Pseudomonas sp. UBA1879 TaxID=1947305 RepID=UPI0025FA23D6|nr:BrnA antitoxin family protein [Pseudomonas sp. UBA1879]